jgi:F-box and WD-40 domain protein CDC4
VALDTIRGRCVSGDADGVIMVWDIKTGQRIHTMLGHTNLVGLMAVSPNMIVSAAADSTIRTWDADSGAACQVLASHTGAITCFQHDETKIVSGSEDGLKVWDLKTGQCVRELLTGVNNVWQVRFKNNTCVAASNRNGATMFDVFRFKCLNSETTPSQMTAENSNWDVETRQPWEREDPLQSPIPEQPTTPIPPNRQKGRLIMPPKASRGSTIRLSPQDPNPDRAADDRGRAFLFPPEGTPQQGSKS